MPATAVAISSGCDELLAALDLLHGPLGVEGNRDAPEMALAGSPHLGRPVVERPHHGVLQMPVLDVGGEQAEGRDPQRAIDAGEIHVDVAVLECVLVRALVGQAFAARPLVAAALGAART